MKNPNGAFIARGKIIIKNNDKFCFCVLWNFASLEGFGIFLFTKNARLLHFNLFF